MAKNTIALKCHTCHFVNEMPAGGCPLVECPQDGQEYSCENEIRTHNKNYEVKKVSVLAISDNF